MGHYQANIRDIEFNLFEVFGRENVLGSGAFADLDVDTARDILRQVARLAENEVADSFEDSDRNPPIFNPAAHSASLPESFKKSYKAYIDAEFWRASLPAELGGIAAPRSLMWAMAELILGANPALHMYSAGYTFASVLHELGTPQQRRLAELMIEKHWGSTMVLTEPEAGSDVGAGVTKAVQQPDGTWHLHGVKRFITSGDADIFDNIVHLVLARPQGAGPGTKGLSLFCVPKFHVDLDTGELGERNGVFVTNVEHKMGLKVSTTCEVRFGEVDDVPAVATLVGDVHDGIAQMFRIIEFARMEVGTKAIATLSTGYLNALEYAKQRVQGADLARMGDKSAPRVTITHHPDIRRSLMLQKAYAEGLRALVLFTACQQDTVLGAREQAEAFEPGSELDLAERVNDLLLPVVKGFGSERAWTLLGTESLQTFGGSGFLADFPIEQYVRDAKIDTLYEGTTAIQAQDFFFRKILRDKGIALGWLSQQIGATVAGGAASGGAASGEGDALARERVALGRALGDVATMVETLTKAAMGADPRTGGDPRSVYLVGLHATRLLMCAGDLVLAWLLVRQADVALAALAQGSGSSNSKGQGSKGSDEAFYRGKIAAAQFFARTVLPHITADRVVVENADLDLMDLPEDSF